MSEKRLFNYLQLAYTPISNYDFAVIKDDPIIKEYINSGRIYIIAQRAVLTFEHLEMDLTDQMNPLLTFEIHQKGNDSILKGKLPIYQSSFGADNDNGIAIAITYTYPNPDDTLNHFPFNNVANFVFKSERDEYFWFSPEKFLYHLWRNAIEGDIIGDIGKFTKYQVHYIGKATEQDIIERLTGHSHLQDILSTEYPFHYGSLPTDEIALLFFEFSDNIQMHTFGMNDDIKDAVDILMGNNPITQRTIYLDAEKALISALKPKHNRQLYKNYPESVDGLKKHSLDIFTYSFSDPITLIYSDGEIKGQSEFLAGDTIIIKNGKKLKIKVGAIKSQELRSTIF